MIEQAMKTATICRECGHKDGSHAPDCRAIERAAQKKLQAECDHRPEYGVTRTTGEPLGPPLCGRCGLDLEDALGQAEARVSEARAHDARRVLISARVRFEELMNKIDLNGLERRLHGRSACPDLDPSWPSPGGGERGPRLCVTYPKCQCGKEDKRGAVTANGSEVLLSLIARIRELEKALNDALAYTIPGDERDRLVEILAKGVMLA